MKCLTYRSSRRDNVILYVLDEKKLDDLPEELKTLLGKPKFMISFELTPERKIVKLNAKELIDTLLNQGYFLRIDSLDEENNLLNQERSKNGLKPIKNEKLI